jgi:prephenate dehydrogenase
VVLLAGCSAALASYFAEQSTISTHPMAAGMEGILDADVARCDKDDKSRQTTADMQKKQLFKRLVAPC